MNSLLLRFFRKQLWVEWITPCSRPGYYGTTTTNCATLAHWWHHRNHPFKISFR